jgi:site-specific recombinase XerD
VLRGQGRRRHRSLQWSTIRKYLSYLRPILETWADDVTSLREVAATAVEAALRAVTGTTAQDRHVALRSLFGALKQERLIFRDPTRGISLPGHQRPPVGLPTGALPALFERADTSFARTIITMIAVHALAPTTVRILHLDQVDLTRGQLILGTGVRCRTVPLDAFTHHVLGEWLCERRRRWPRTDNPHLLVSAQTVADPRNPPISEMHLWRVLGNVGVTATQLRTDRVLDEARHTADPVHLMRLFGLSATTAMNYVATAHPDQGANTRR